MNAPATHAPSQPVRSASAYRALVMKGLTQQEAGNIVATMAGIPVAGQAWTLREVNHLVFLRALHDAGRWESGTTAPLALPRGADALG